jgi:UDP-N-acetylglucosamine 2-epimerase (non-hydrolysing)
MRILTVFGTRPEAIKMAPVIRAAKDGGMDTSVCVTAQHRGMLDQMMEVFGIAPDFDLNLMQENQSPLSVAARVFEALAPVIVSVQPDWLLVQGDTTTAFAAAFVGYQHRVRVAHIEAGLRTSDKWQPFPEEMNRRLVTVLADLHFAPTQRAMDALAAGGVPADRICVTGNTVVDALQEILKRPAKFADPRLRVLTGRIVVLTAHRRENFGERLEQICLAATDLLRKFPDITLVFPVHPNPHVTEMAHRLLGGEARAVLTAPLAYPDFVHLMKSAALILSDSGGVQEEAPSIGTPVLVLRDVTERPEAVESGWAKLVGTSRSKILEQATDWLGDEKHGMLRSRENPFGDGKASGRIVRALQQFSPPTA